MICKLNAWLAVAVGICLSGCKGPAPAQSYANDPLLISKKPVEGKPNGAAPVMLANRGPVPPLPSDRLADDPSGAEEAAEQGAISQATDADRRPEMAVAPGSRPSAAWVLQRELRQ
jgi:hypothetical protein